VRGSEELEQLDLYVRGSTRLSRPLQQVVDNGYINLWRLLSE
jgi:hypothetical protein